MDALKKASQTGVNICKATWDKSWGHRLRGLPTDQAWRPAALVSPFFLHHKGSPRANRKVADGSHWGIRALLGGQVFLCNGGLMAELWVLMAREDVLLDIKMIAIFGCLMAKRITWVTLGPFGLWILRFESCAVWMRVWLERRSSTSDPHFTFPFLRTGKNNHKWSGAWTLEPGHLGPNRNNAGCVPLGKSLNFGSQCPHLYNKAINSFYHLRSLSAFVN